jgi:hypothetical protein
LRHDRISRDAPGVRPGFLVFLSKRVEPHASLRIDTGGAVSL